MNLFTSFASLGIGRNRCFLRTLYPRLSGCHSGMSSVLREIPGCRDTSAYSSPGPASTKWLREYQGRWSSNVRAHPPWQSLFGLLARVLSAEICPAGHILGINISLGTLAQVDERSCDLCDVLSCIQVSTHAWKTLDCCYPLVRPV